MSSCSNVCYEPASGRNIHNVIFIIIECLAGVSGVSPLNGPRIYRSTNVYTKAVQARYSTVPVPSALVSQS